MTPVADDHQGRRQQRQRPGVVGGHCDGHVERRERQIKRVARVGVRPSRDDRGGRLVRHHFGPGGAEQAGSGDGDGDSGGGERRAQGVARDLGQHLGRPSPIEREAGREKAENDERRRRDDAGVVAPVFGWIVRHGPLPFGRVRITRPDRRRPPFPAAVSNVVFLPEGSRCRPLNFHHKDTKTPRILNSS